MQLQIKLILARYITYEELTLANHSNNQCCNNTRYITYEELTLLIELTLEVIILRYITYEELTHRLKHHQAES